MNPSPPPLGPNEVVTWVRVEPEIFDIVGVIAASLGFVILCVSLAVFLGSFVGVGLILRRRRAEANAPPSLLVET